MANHSYSPDGYVIGAAPADAHTAGTASGSKATGAGTSRVQGREVPSPPEDHYRRLEILYRAVERFGVPVVLLAIILWWARNDLIEPLLRAHFDFIDTVITSHKEHTEELRGIGDKLEQLIEVTQRKQ